LGVTRKIAEKVQRQNSHAGESDNPAEAMGLKRRYEQMGCAGNEKGYTFGRGRLKAT
jgi:hypothetical protein